MKAVKLLLLVNDLSVLPVELAVRVVSIVSEPAFGPADTLRAFECLAARNYAIHGVEFWLKTDKGPYWQASSNFELETCADLKKEDWPAYAACCRRSATEFVQRFAEPNVVGTLFIYTWGWESAR
jgi:hypothetical protein